MELTHLTSIVLLFAANMCRGEIVIKNSKQEKSMGRLTDDLINIVTSCYKDQINGVGLAGNLPGTLIKRLSVQHSIPVALIDNYWSLKDKVPHVEVQFRQKLNVFIIEASSTEKFRTLVEMNIRYSMWWNHMASFFILDLSPGCVNAINYEYLAWKANILNAKVMCSQNKRGRVIYNCNPFTSQAPITWRRYSVSPGRNKHPFTVFRRAYRENETICVDLDFDKTENLAGHAILVNKYPKNFLKSIVKTGSRAHYALNARRVRILGTISCALNGTLHFVPDRRSFDIRAQVRVLEFTWAVGRDMIAYPFDQIAVSVITQFRGHMSQLNKILTVIDVNSQYGMGVVYLITLIFFKFFVHQAVVPALLNLVRVTSNTGFANLPNDTASRIYLGTLLFFVVTMQAIFQGDLAALLTKHIPLRNVNTVQDLQDLGYREIYVALPNPHLLDSSDLKKNVIATDVAKCIERVKNDLSVACIGISAGKMIDMVQKFNLHISSKPVQNIHVAFPIRWNWPLEQKVNSIIARMVEANVLDTWEVHCNGVKISDFYVDSADKSNVDFKSIEFHEVRFMFVILGIGLVCATIVFIIELVTRYKYKCAIEVWCHVVRR